MKYNKYVSKGSGQCANIAQSRKSGCAVGINQSQGCLWHILRKSRIFDLFVSQSVFVEYETARFSKKMVATYREGGGDVSRRPTEGMRPQREMSAAD